MPFRKLCVVLCILGLGVWLAACGTPQSEPQSAPCPTPAASDAPPDYSFAVPAEQCAVCGTCPQLAISALWGHENIAFLDLNTFDVLELPINRYAPRGPLLEQPAGFSAVVSANLGGASLTFLAAPDRGMASGWLEWQAPARLCPQQAGQFLCEACLRALTGDAAEEMPLALAAVHLGERRIVPLSGAGGLLQMGDFFLHCPQLAGTLQAGPAAGRAEMLVCLCPPRYGAAGTGAPARGGPRVVASLAQRLPAVPGRVKGFRCQFRAKRDGIQYQKAAARNEKNPVCGRRASDAGGREFSAS